MTKHIFDSLSVREIGGSVFAYWTDVDGNRYSTSLDPETGEPQEQPVRHCLSRYRIRINKNPPSDLRRGQHGHFDTRQLDGESKANAPIIAEVVRRVREGDMIAKARAEEVAKEEAKAAAARAESIESAKAAITRLAGEFRAENRPQDAEQVESLLTLPDESLLTFRRILLHDMR